MTFPKLLLYIAIAIISFWLLGFAIELAAWAIYVVMLIVLVLFIVWLIQKWYEDYQARTSTKAATTSKRSAPSKAKTTKTAAAKVPAKPKRKSTTTAAKPKRKSTKK